MGKLYLENMTKDPNAFKHFLDKILQWLNSVLPTAVTVGSIIYRYMARRLLQKENKIQELELEKKLLENKSEVENDTKNMSNSDIIDGAIRDGGKLRDRKPKA